jgi:GT2 family glycosyltransferase
MLSKKASPFVSVIIPVRNEEGYIEKCIKSLVDQGYPGDCFEVLAVDGMSADDSKKIIQLFSNQYSNISLFENPNLLTSFGLNIGIKESRGEIIIILGAHTFVAPDFITKNIEVLENRDADCVGGKIKSLGATYLARTISLAMASPFGVGDALFRYSEIEGYVDTVAFGAYKRAVFDKIGLFDEKLAKNQDDEFNYRLRKMGGKILISPQIRSFYYSRATLKKLWAQYFLYGFWKIRVLQKHLKMMRLRHFIPSTFVLSVLLSGVCSWHYPIFFFLLLLILISYSGNNLFFSFKVAKIEGWQYLPLLPLAFFILHFSYGIGFLLGLIRFSPKWFQKEPEPPKL